MLHICERKPLKNFIAEEESLDIRKYTEADNEKERKKTSKMVISEKGKLLLKPSLSSNNTRIAICVYCSGVCN